MPKKREIKSHKLQKCIFEKNCENGLNKTKVTLTELLKYGRSLETVKLQVSNMPSTNAENSVHETKQTKSVSSK